MASSEQRAARLVESLEVAAARCDDIVPRVYAQLFSTRPDLRDLFAVEQDAPPRSGMGNMVNEILRMVLADDASAMDAEAQAAVVFHVGWGLDLDMYRDVLRALMTAVRGACGDAWSPSMSAAWEAQLGDVLSALHRQYGLIEVSSQT